MDSALATLAAHGDVSVTHPLSTNGLLAIVAFFMTVCIVSVCIAWATVRTEVPKDKKEPMWPWRPEDIGHLYDRVNGLASKLQEPEKFPRRKGKK